MLQKDFLATLTIRAGRGTLWSVWFLRVDDAESARLSTFKKPSHALRPGVIYEVDKKSGSTMLVLDVSRDLTPLEQSRMIVQTEATSVSISSNDAPVRSLVATLLEYFGLNHELAKRAATGTTLPLDKLIVQSLSRAAFIQKLSETDFLKQRDLQGFFVIVETLNVKSIQFEFANESAEMVRSAIEATPSARIEGQFRWASKNTLSFNYDGGLAVAFKAARFTAPGSLSSDFRPVVLKLQQNRGPTKPQSNSKKRLPTKLVETSDFPDPTAGPAEKPVVPTHEKPEFGPIQDPQKKTYGELLREIQSALQNAGMGESRVIPLGSGFGVVSALEVLQDDGEKPLTGKARFYTGGDYKDRRQNRGEGMVNLTIKSFIERRRAYVIGVDAGTLPSVSSSDPEMLFRLQYAGIDLPDYMKLVRVDPGTRVIMFVYEFSKHNNEPSKLLSYGDCGQKIEDHLIQDQLGTH